MTDPSTLLSANRRRRRARRIVLIATAPLVVLALLFCAKLLSMYAFAQQAMSSYAAGDYAGTAAAAHGQEPLNIFEPYKAPFNLGVGLADGGNLPGAVAAFTRALDLASGLEECAVRVNLGIVWERTGDLAQQNGDAVEASRAWQEALLVSQGAPDACRSPEADDASPDPDRSMDETLDEQQQRLREKLEERPEEQQSGPTPDDSDLEGLEEQLDQGAQDRDERDAGGEGDGGSGTDRPW